MKRFFLILFIFALSGIVYSQSADFITNLIDAEQATYGHLCYLNGVYTGIINENASLDEAVAAYQKEGLVSESIKADDAVNYETAAKIMCGFWKIKGGLFYKLSKESKRYSFKQLKNDKVIPARADPWSIPKGTDVLNIFTVGTNKYNSVKISK